ncbi:MAG: CotH kinase family protein [Candidatus Symbiothrix sp.]|jgi:hypothetical protein|nr:CotH kinase family protein [Candidatus Symbiothrix sp.]
MKNTSFLSLFLFCLLANTSVSGQTSSKLQPVNIIGTVYSVDYDNNNGRSTTVNTKNNAFDGNFDTFFASYDRSNTWVGLDLGEKTVITKVAYGPRTEWAQRLELGVFEGANHPDFGDAVLLGVIQETPVERKLTELPVNNSRGFRYVRYVGPHDVRCNIAELEFYGYKSEGNDSQLTQITRIPDVIIHTTNARDITSKTEYIKGMVTFISKDGAVVYTDSLEIRGRGNASWGFEKKPYRIKLAKKARILDNPAEARNWTLINNYGDKTLMRNLLAFNLSQSMQMPYTPAGQPVNVYLNGEYKGCYQLCDQIDVRKDRVDVKEMKPTDISGENLTGGYLIEIDAYAYDEAKWFNSSRNTPVTIKSPDDEAIVSQQFDYINSHFNQWETAVYSPGYKNPDTGFRKYMDTKTFIRHFLVGELSGNTDTYWSVYMYKQRNDDKFYFGPVWDFDLAFENDNRTYPVCGQTGNSDWIFRRGSYAGEVRTLVNRLLTDNEFYKEIQTTYSNYRDWGRITEEKLIDLVDYYAVLMDSSQKMNFKRWNILNQRVHQNNQPAGSYAGEVNIVKKYLKARIAWMDKKLSYVPDPDNKEPELPVAIGNPGLASLRLWTASNTIHIEGITESTFVEVFNFMGQVVHRQKTTGALTLAVSRGVYIVRFSTSQGEIQTTKCFVTD